MATTISSIDQQNVKIGPVRSNSEMSSTGANADRAIPEPPDNSYARLDVDEQFEANFSPEDALLDRERSVTDRNREAVYYYRDEQYGNAYVKWFEHNELDTHHSADYNRIRRTYPIAKEIGLKAPEVACGEHWIATKEINGKNVREADINQQELMDMLAKVLATGNIDINTQNILTTQEGSPYYIDYGCFRRYDERAYSARRGVANILEIQGIDIRATELLEARAVSLATHFPKRVFEATPRQLIEAEHEAYQPEQFISTITDYFPLTRADVDPFEYDIWDISVEGYLSATT